jgi:hypothetical protein
MDNRKIKKILIFIIASIAVGAGFIVFFFVINNMGGNVPFAVSDPFPAGTPGPLAQNNNAAILPAESAIATESIDVLVWPLTNAPSRITKKPFGLKVTLKNSPVSRERFSGYHVGADLEIFPDERDAIVPVRVVCSGPLRMKKWATGYGGVAVQQCELFEGAVTVVYGHLNIDSIRGVVGDALHAGDEVGVLGKGFSKETDQERKHLHLGIHKGEAIVILGYVQDAASISDWIDPAQYFTKR